MAIAPWSDIPALLPNRARLLTAALAVTVALACLPGGARSAGHAPGAPAYRYVSPVPGSKYVSARNTIAVRPGGAIDRATIGRVPFTVTGARSGRHDGDWVLSDDGRTLIFRPSRPYAPGERVSVTLKPGPRTADGRAFPPLDFWFTVSPRDPSVPVPTVSHESELFPRGEPAAAPVTTPEWRALPGTDDLPPLYPPIIVLDSNDPKPGCYFMAPLTYQIRAPLVIIDELGMPIFYRRQPVNLMNFGIQQNLLTYFDQMANKAYALDSLYAVVDSFEAGNGYYADFHDMQLLPDGHFLVICYDSHQVGMDTVVTGGDPDAYVAGLVVQELDASRNVVFQWRSWDHFEITDAVDVDLTRDFVDYVHGNAVEKDTDGNLMISSRHLNEITKIDRETGEVIWRWGLNAVHNDFTFVNDTRGFAHQHDIRRAPNGNVTLFDNGNFLDPQYSRALEYALDEVNMTATLVWEYRPTPDGWSNSSGGVQNRGDDGTLIAWGAGTVIPDVTDFHADGTKAFEITFHPGGMTTYKAYRFPWRGRLIATETDSIHFGLVATDSTAERTLAITNNGAQDLTITSFVLTDPVFFSIAEAPPLLIPQGGTVDVRVRFHPGAIGRQSARLYIRSSSENELVAQTVELKGFGAQPFGVPIAGRPLLLLLGLLTAGGAVAALRRRRVADVRN